MSVDASLRAQWVQQANDIGQTGLGILSGAPVTVTEKRFADPKLLAIILMSRSLSDFKGVFTGPAQTLGTDS